MILSLKEVTLVCFDTKNIGAALDSMSHSLSQAKFAESIFFTSKSVCTIEAINKAKVLGIKIEFVPEVISVTEYSFFILAKLDNYIHSNFCLITQWDGWIINSEFWDPDFLNYDYIGAIWPQYSDNKVGNGGFSLRSKKLLKSTRDLIISMPDYKIPLIEDDYICREHRQFFEQKYQIKFPSNEIANKFSIERNGIPIKSFGFHGMYNFNFVVEIDSDLRILINKLSDVCFLDRASYDLARYLLEYKRFGIAKLIIVKRLRVIGLSTKNVKLIFLLLSRIPLKFLQNKLPY
jgi:hypothetical protein